MPADPWTELTWDDLTAWAGTKSVQRGKSYFNTGRVSRLARTTDGGLLATVQGTMRYATHAFVQRGKLESECSCPVGERCKHAVAVILAYTAAVDGKKAIPTAGDNDPLWAMFDGGDRDDEDFDDHEHEGEEDDEYAAEVVARAGARGGVARTADAKRPRVKAKPGRPPTVEEYVLTLSEAEVRELLLAFARSVPAVKKELAGRAALSTGDAGTLVRQARAELRKQTKEDAWRHHWDGEGSQPDYGPLRRMFETLLEMQAFDELAVLGQELFERGTEQIERSDDEGETQSAIRDCLTVAWKGLVRSSRPLVDQWLWLTELALNEEFDLIEFPTSLQAPKFARAEWSRLADDLLAKVPTTGPGTDRFSSQRYRRDRRTDAAIRALDKAGRTDDATALCEREAPLTDSYVRLVDRLLNTGREADAEKWIVAGVANTQKTLPGIARQLADKRRDLAVKRKDHVTVAAFAAADFFEWPSVERLDKLLKAAKAAKCEDGVRAGAMQFLETGELPKPPTKKGVTGWPLPPAPVPTEPRQRFGSPLPHFSVLIDLALRAGDHDGALRWYDRWTVNKAAGFHNGYSETIAAAVRGTHPERALALYRAVAESLVEASRYDDAKPRLKQVRDLFTALGQPAEWTAYEAALRVKYSRRRNLMPVLDSLAGKPKKLTEK